jgi:VanZ family protein
VKLLARWLPVILWMAVIFTMSSWSTPPSLPESLLDLLMKKAVHITEYAILAGLLWRALGGGTERRVMLAALAVAVFYAVSDEFHQSFTPGRSPSPVDVLIDGTGAAAGLMVLAALQRRRGRRGQPTGSAR